MIARTSNDRVVEEIEVPSASNGGTSQPAGGPAPLLALLWRRRWTILAALVLCIGAAVIYLRQATPIYTSSSRVYIQQFGTRILSDDPGGSSKSGSFLYTQAQVIRSSPLLGSALEKLDVRGMKTFAGVDNPVGVVQQALRVDVGKQDDILNVSMDSPYAREAADIINSVVGAYVAHQSEQKKSTAAEVLRILQKEKGEREAELEKNLQAMLKFKQENGALSFNNEKGNIILERLGTLSTSLTMAELNGLESRARRDAAKQALREQTRMNDFMELMRGRDPLARDAEYDALRVELRKAQAALETLTATQGSRNRQVVALQTGVESLSWQVAEKEKLIAKSYLTQLELDCAAAEQRVREITTAYAAQQKLALELNGKSAEFARLEAGYERTQKHCDLLDSRIKEVSVNSEDAGLALNVQVLEVARPPVRPTSPQRPRTLAIALLGGLALGVGLAFVRERFDQRLRDPEEVAEALGLSVLGVVPHMEGNLTVSARGQQVQHEAMSEVAEAYRTLRTAIYFGGTKSLRTILVTSPAPGDGKSTSASNLAIAMAQAGHRTVLVDCDFRKPVQHKVFELEAAVGLTTVLATKAKLRDAVRPTPVDRLYVLPCGPIPSNPSEILTGKPFEQLMNALTEAFDRVVIDSPPVAPVSDAQILAASADAVVLVVRTNKSTRRVSTYAVDALQKVGANILGVVVNDMPRRHGRYGYYYGYGYGNDEKGGGRRKRVSSAEVTSDSDRQGRAGADAFARENADEATGADTAAGTLR